MFILRKITHFMKKLFVWGICTITIIHITIYILLKLYINPLFNKEFSNKLHGNFLSFEKLDISLLPLKLQINLYNLQEYDRTSPNTNPSSLDQKKILLAHYIEPIQINCNLWNRELEIIANGEKTLQNNLKMLGDFVLKITWNYSTQMLYVKDVAELLQFCKQQCQA